MPYSKLKTFTKQASLISLMVAGANATVAQDSQDDFFTLEEIIVTAQKREESLQDAPISITAFSRKDMLEAGIDEISDYTYLTPSMSIDEGHNKSDVDIVIRGIAQLGGSQNLMGMYLDGFELTAASNRLLGMALLDIERVEVLRGPQGTTFGRNVVSGALNITSATPKHEFEGESRIEYGRFGELATQHIVNIPLAENVAAVRLAGEYTQGDGYLTNLGSSGDSNDFKTLTLRGTLLFEPNDRLRAKVTMAYSDQDFGAEGRVPDGRLVGAITDLKQLIDAGLGLLPPGTFPVSPNGEFFPDQNRFISTDTPTFQKLENFVAIANVSYDFADGDISWVNVLGYVQNDLDRQFDTDRTDFNVNWEEASFSSDFYSFETRLQSNGAGKLNWVGGLYYSKSTNDSDVSVISGDDMERLTYLHPLFTGLPFGVSLLPNNTRIRGSVSNGYIKSWAGFGEITYDITEKLRVAGGVRYSEDEIDAGRTNGVTFAPNAFGLFDVIPLADIPIDDPFYGDTFDKLTWRLNAQYDVSEDVNVYASVSTGYRAGGLQLGSINNPSFGPESITSYEVGLKALSFDGRLRTNIAIFQMDWTNMQINTIDRNTNESFTDNAGKARIKGVEFDVAARVTENWLITGGLSYIDSVVQDFVDSTGLDRSGIDMPDTPKFSSSLAVQYTHPITDTMDMFVRATHIHTGERLESLIDGNATLQYIDKFDRVDLRAGVETEGWRLEGYVENLFDKVYATGVATAGFSGAGSIVSSPPQRYGVRLSVFY